MAKSRSSYKKGQSGNPGGKPKTLGYVQELARDQTKCAINTLVKIMKSADESGAVRIRAAEALLNRAWGQPTQPVELADENGPVVPVLNLYLNEEAHVRKTSGNKDV